MRILRTLFTIFVALGFTFILLSVIRPGSLPDGFELCSGFGRSQFQLRRGLRSHFIVCRPPHTGELGIRENL